MKRLIALLLCIGFVTASLAQTTNFLWSSAYTSNYIRTNITERMNTNTLYTINIVTSAPPVNTLYFGLTTNAPVTQLGVTNYWWFTNGILTLITNSAT